MFGNGTGAGPSTEAGPGTEDSLEDEGRLDDEDHPDDENCFSTVRPLSSILEVRDEILPAESNRAIDSGATLDEIYETVALGELRKRPSSLFSGPAATIATVSEEGLDSWVALKNRKEQRKVILEFLLAGKLHKEPGALTNYDKQEVTHDLTRLERNFQLSEIAKDYQKCGTYQFNRFERLSILNLLHLQHELVLLDESVEHDGWEDGTSERLQLKLQQYGEHSSFTVDASIFVIVDHGFADILWVHQSWGLRQLNFSLG
jgi:hypothetical protein